MKLTKDAFLGGQVHAWQSEGGYRAGADPVFLAAAVDYKRDQTVLDLGCGVGTAMLCLLAREPGASVTGLEIQSALAELARRNIAENGNVAEVIEGDVGNMPATLRQRSFDHVMSNPPFFSAGAGTNARSSQRDLGRHENMSLSAWIEFGLKRLKPGGTFTMVNRIERLPDTMSALADRVGDIRLLPLAARASRPAKLFVLSAKKGARTPMTLFPPLVLHEGERHEKDGESYTIEAQKILRKGQPLHLFR